MFKRKNPDPPTPGNPPVLKSYHVHYNVTFSGVAYVDAASPIEADQLVREIDQHTSVMLTAMDAPPSGARALLRDFEIDDFECNLKKCSNDAHPESGPAAQPVAA